jgi:FG-GAP-like repeat
MTTPRRCRTAGAAFSLIASLLGAGLSPGGALAIAPAPAATCVDGWITDVVPTFAHAHAVDVALLNGDPWLVGYAIPEETRFTAYSAKGAGDTWADVLIPPARSATILTAIAPDGTKRLWASGASFGHLTQPVVERWTAPGWRQLTMPTLKLGGGLTGITAVSAASTLAVGYRSGADSMHPLALRRKGSRWTLDSPHIKAAGEFTYVTRARDGAAWAVGWKSTKAGVKPLIQRWKSGAWHGYATHVPGDGVLTSIAVRSATDAWAVGYAIQGATLSPLVVHWNGRAWRPVPAPEVNVQGGSMLRGVAIISGGVIAVGADWDSSGLDSRPLLATLTGDTWDVVTDPGTIGHGELLAVMGDPLPMTVGRLDNGPLVLVPCTSDPVPGSIGGLPGVPSKGTDTPGGEAAVGSVATDAAQPESNPVPTASPALPGSGTLAGADAARAGAAALPPPISLPGLEVRDLTDAAGLSEVTRTYGGNSADFDGDGWPDLEIGRHSKLILVLRNNRDGTFSPPFQAGFEQADRHGCSVGDIDLDGLPDIACAIGANHGLGIKSDEVWLSPFTQGATNQAQAMGVDDPIGRGRRTVLFDADHDGDDDLYIANDPNRTDGLPSLNHLFLNNGGRGFSPDPEAGLDLPIGAECLVPADLDGDGWTDLVVCEDVPDASYHALRIYHNDHGHFHEVTAAMGITTIGDLDARVADMNGDGSPDLVRVLSDRLEVDLQQGGTFVKAAAFAVPGAQTVALADVNGDGRPDIYVSCGTGADPGTDVLLVNAGDGVGYTSVALPGPVDDSAGGGAVPIDFDRNGKTDLVVLHGSKSAYAPIQLLAFGPPWPIIPAVAPSPTQTPAPTPLPSPTTSIGLPSPSPSAAPTPAPEAPGADTGQPLTPVTAALIALAALVIAGLAVIAWRRRRTHQDA